MPTTESPRACPDPACGAAAEPEQDGDLNYWTCVQCGYDFGFTRPPVLATDCPVGIPEPVRRRASVAAGSLQQIGLQP